MATTTTELLQRAQDATRELLQRERTNAPSAGYAVLPYTAGPGLRRHAVFNVETGRAVDTFQTVSGARHAAHLLNVGAATLHPHGLTGCRVQPLATGAR